jgi:hypothetical protein
MRARPLIPLAAFAAGQLLGADAPPPAPVDPEVTAILGGISAERIQRSIFVLASTHTRHSLSDPLPSGDGIGSAAAWIRGQLDQAAAGSAGRLKVEPDTFDQPPVPPQVPAPVQLTNLIATLPGTDPASAGRFLVISAHYDSCGSDLLDAAAAAPGADDDGSGVAAVIELARVMAPYRFPATIVFAVFTGEEQGALGSAHWAQLAQDHGAQIEADLNNDLIGNSRSDAGQVDRHSVRLFAAGVPPREKPDDALLALLRAGGENDTPPRELARAVRDIGAAYLPALKVRLIYRGDRYRRGGDQDSFLAHGYAAVRLTEPAEDFHHQHQDVRTEQGVPYGDLPDAVDFAYVADVARLDAAALAQLARAPAPPRQVEIETVLVDNDTTLRWRPNAEASLAGYRIVWRETTSPSWEHALDVPKAVNRYTLAGLSKDNVVFGVEAVDQFGRASPAVFPAERRTL